MRIPDLVVAELWKRSDLTFTDRSVYLWCFAFQPESVRAAAKELGLRWHTVAKACNHLAEKQWMALMPKGRGRCPVALIPLSCQVKLAQQLEKDYAQATNKGEFLMKKHLDLRLRCDEFMDNARPEPLTRKGTDQPLELDRLYGGLKIAFEFNGLQHMGTTETYNDAAAQKDLADRDLIKDSLSRKAGISLVVVTADDLRSGAFEKLIPENIPQRYVDEAGPYYQTLARISTAYADKTGRYARPQQPQQPQQPRSGTDGRG